MNRKFAPLAEDHPSIGTVCPACFEAFKPGDVVTIVTLGPGKDPEQQRKAREGRPYAAVGSLAHWTCVTGEE